MTGIELLDVLQSGNCSGCGACVVAGAAERLALDDDGHLRPVPAKPDPRRGRSRAVLADYCPALAVARPAPPAGATVDPDFGAHIGVWAAHATDPQVRWAASSGGALTAIAGAALMTGTVREVVSVSGEAGTTRSRARVARTEPEVVECASSRYAPVSTLEALAGREDLRALAIVARPCEAAALRQLTAGSPDAPLILSFFCAGVPSQLATDLLIERLGCAPQDVATVRYRGNGWPGRFTVGDGRGLTYTASYEDSWGRALGPTVQPRCKICVDGVGESADVVAADLWEADEHGYPLFEDAPGQSLLIARTQRGQSLVEGACSAGYLIAEGTDLEQARAVQDLQVNRRRHLIGRLLGRRLAGRAVPRYRGFQLWRWLLMDPLGNIRQARGSFARARHSGPRVT